MKQDESTINKYKQDKKKMKEGNGRGEMLKEDKSKQNKDERKWK